MGALMTGPRRHHSREQNIERGWITCFRCKNLKAPGSFHINNSSAGKRSDTCRSCATKSPERTLANLKDAILLPMQRRWNEENSE